MRFVEINKSLVGEKLKFPLFTETGYVWAAGTPLGESDLIKLKAEGFTHVFIDESYSRVQSNIDCYIRSTLEQKIPSNILEGIFSVIEQSENICVLLNAIHDYDLNTFKHSLLTARTVINLCKELDYLEVDILHIAVASLLHDVGKCCLPITLLNRPGVLDSRARWLMEKHVWYSFLIISNTWDSDLAELVYTHHERMDGTGYPRKLCGDEISEAAKILMIADVFSALTEERAYKEPYTNDVAMDIIRNSFSAEDILCTALNKIVFNVKDNGLKKLAIL